MNTGIRAFWQELAAVLRDKAVVVVMLGGSLFYALFYPLPYQPQVASHLPIGVLDHDRSVMSRELIRRIDASESVNVVLSVPDAPRLERMVRDGQLAGYVEIPARLNAQVLRGEPVRVAVFANAAYMVLYSETARAVSEAVLDFNAEIVEQRLLAAGRSPVLAENLPEPIALDRHELFNPDGGYANYIVPAVLVLILQQTFLIGICMMQVGRSRLPAGAAGLTTLAGRTLAYLTLQMTLLLLYLVLVYRVFGFPSLGSTGLALLTLLPAFLGMILLGQALGTFFKTRETALQVMMLVSIPALFLAGFAWPAEVIPWPLDTLGWLIPSTAAIDAFIKTHHMGASLHEVRGSWLMSWALAAGYGVAAWWLGRLGGQAVFITPEAEAE
ncbi:MAG: ABC transporter permease [Wenzhouxiangella sp.]